VQTAQKLICELHCQLDVVTIPETVGLVFGSHFAGKGKQYLVLAYQVKIFFSLVL
jgi:hypothetical protein